MPAHALICFWLSLSGHWATVPLSAINDSYPPPARARAERS